MYDAANYQTVGQIEAALRVIAWPDHWIHPDNYDGLRNFLWENVARRYIEINYDRLVQGQLGRPCVSQ